MQPSDSEWLPTHWNWNSIGYAAVRLDLRECLYISLDTDTNQWKVCIGKRGHTATLATARQFVTPKEAIEWLHEYYEKLLNVEIGKIYA